MKTATIVAIILMISFSAYSAPVENVVSSALMSGDSVIYNLDFIDPFGLPILDVIVNSRMGNTEFMTTMDHLGTPPHYINTYEGVQQYSNPSGSIEFYGRVEADTLLLTQSYKNSSNQFPPDPILYAELADDPTGDTQPGTLGQWLDITGSAITYSDDRLFVRLDNAGGGWPTSQGFNFFAYGFVLYNPDSPSLSATALAYASIPFVLTPGIYNINLQDTSFTRIADIQYQTSGNSLHMSCAISDLLQDPNWSQWPPEAEYILTGGITLSIVSLQPSLNDYTYPSAFVPMTQYLDTEQNSTPVIGNIVINPIPDVFIEAFIEYGDADNNLPIERLFFFDDVPYEMGSSDHFYVENPLFDVTIPAPHDDWHTYYFRFSDGDEAVETELDSVYLTGIGINDATLPSNVALYQNYPNPFNAQTSIGFELANRSNVNLSIYDITGGIVATLAEREFEAGSHTIIWDGTDKYGTAVSSGIYFYKFEAESFIETRRMILLK